MFCSKCGNQLSADATFCGACGNHQAVAATPTNSSETGGGPQPTYTHSAQASVPPWVNPQAQRPNNIANTSLIMGILSIFFGFIFAVLAIIFGIMGLKNSQRLSGDGRSQSIVGIVLGGVGIVVWIIAIVMIVALVMYLSRNYNWNFVR